ncbi:galactose mutarotase-like domain-containing protein [Schizophyllum amplum]|uniref:Galactose mutarotase-like domain-containing protein n=1 Tax=Schizophyllum amplum TaxID=97359 RepID=A0A550CIA2_9AGAR|nr:galactose mutarotase-like domain-containing protein [Auriculariopsis ampla]
MAEFKPVLLTLPSLGPALVLEIIPYGLTIHRMYVQADGKTHDIMVGPEKPEDHVTRKYINSIIGRYTNRLPVKPLEFERNGVKGEFTPIPNESERVSLHGGPLGFGAIPWTQLAPSETPKLFTAAELAALGTPSDAYAFFRHTSPSGDQNFPGTLHLETLVALVPPASSLTTAEQALGSVTLVYRARLDDAAGPLVTPINITQHWGFNLEASLGADNLDVRQHALMLAADHFAERDADALPLGGFAAAAGTPHAHTGTLVGGGKLVGDGYPPTGYDDYYLFRKDAVASVPSHIAADKFTPEADFLSSLVGAESKQPAAAVLSSAKSGLKVRFDSNQGGVMCYTNCWSNPVKSGTRKKIHGGSGDVNTGDGYPPHTAVFLEFHHPLASFLIPENKDTELDTLLTTGEVYNNYVRCDVSYTVPA